MGSSAAAALPQQARLPHGTDGSLDPGDSRPRPGQASQPGAHIRWERVLKGCKEKYYKEAFMKKKYLSARGRLVIYEEETVEGVLSKRHAYPSLINLITSNFRHNLFQQN